MKGETQFTPGPWRVERAFGSEGQLCFLEIRGAGPYRGDVAQLHAAEHIDGITCAERDANAALVAAAPDLYEAVEWLYRALNSNPPDGGPQKDVYNDNVIYRLDGQAMYAAINKARAALSRARGEAQGADDGE